MHSSSVFIAHATATIVVVIARASRSARETHRLFRFRLPRVVIRALIRIVGVD